MSSGQAKRETKHHYEPPQLIGSLKQHDKRELRIRVLKTRNGDLIDVRYFEPFASHCSSLTGTREGISVPVRHVSALIRILREAKAALS